MDNIKRQEDIHEQGNREKNKNANHLVFPHHVFYVHHVQLETCLTSFQNNLKVYSVIESDTEIGRMICSVTWQDIIWRRVCEMCRPDKPLHHEFRKLQLGLPLTDLFIV